MTTALDTRSPVTGSSDLPLRVLMVLHMPWDGNLGAPRVQLELADEFRSRGHVVDKFCYTDAFPREPSSKLGTVLRRSFAGHAQRHVRSVGSRFDVIDAHHGNLPYAKSDLGFAGLLVARSSGLYRFYRDFERYERRRWPDEPRGTLPGRTLRRWQSWREALRQRRSLGCADLINVPNDEEQAFVRDELGLGHKCVVIPNGLAHARFTAFERESGAPESKLVKPRVAFIGYWSPRKGSRDWGAIVRSVRAEVPEAGFDFLGTGCDEGAVLSDLALDRSEGVRVVPSFDSDQLPRLLAEATVGAFPSYIEGFGLGVLEKLAAGIPTVAYNVPGPRAILRELDHTLLTPAGDTAALAARVVAMLRMSAPDYAALAARCRAQARQHSWSTLAERTLAVYAERLAEVRGR